MAQIKLFAVGVALLCVYASAQSDEGVAPVSMIAGQGMQPPVGSIQEVPVPAPAPAPAKAKAVPAATAKPIPVYAPHRSFSRWVIDLKHDPTILIAFIICLLSGVGSLFIVYALGAELVQSIPYAFQSQKYSNAQQPSPARTSPASSMDEKMKTSY